MLKRLLIAAAMLTAVPITSEAQTNDTAFMGVITSDADTHVEIDTSAKFGEAAVRLGLDTAKNTMTVRQAMLAYGCVSIDVECAQKITQPFPDGIGKVKLVWGTISHPAGGNYKVTLSRYDPATHQIEQRSTEEVPTYDVANEMLRLLGVSDEYMKDAQATGYSGVAGPPPPMPLRSVETVVIEGNVDFEEPAIPNTTEVDVIPPAAGDKDLIAASAVMVDDDAHRWRKIVGWSSIGVGAVGATMAIIGAVRVMKFDKDASLQEYRAQFPGSIDTCDEASRGNRAGLDEGVVTRVNEVCGASSRLRALQWVGLGVGVAGIGTGMYFLLKPVVTTNRAGLEITSKF